MQRKRKNFSLSPTLVYLLLWTVYFGVFFGITNKLQHRQVVGYFERLVSPGYGSCARCGRPWNWCNSHDTIFKDYEPIMLTDSQSVTLDIEKDSKYFGAGCFPLCEDCWKELTPEQRLHYYQEMVGNWVAYAYNYKEMKLLIASWPSIEKAVKEGK